jgi:hypothetical protein
MARPILDGLVLRGCRGGDHFGKLAGLMGVLAFLAFLSAVTSLGTVAPNLSASSIALNSAIKRETASKRIFNVQEIAYLVKNDAY